MSSKNSLANFKAGKHFLIPGYASFMKTMFAAHDDPTKRYDLNLWLFLGGNGFKGMGYERKNITWAEYQAEIDKFVGHLDTLSAEAKKMMIEDYELND